MITAAVDIRSCSRSLFVTQNHGFAQCDSCMRPSGRLRRGHGGASPSPAATQNHGFVSQAGRGNSAVSHRRHVCCVTQQTCLLCDTAELPLPACDTKPWFCIAAGEGLAPPCPRRNRPLGHIQELHYKTMVLRRKHKALEQNLGSQHLP